MRLTLRRRRETTIPDDSATHVDPETSALIRDVREHLSSVSQRVEGLERRVTTLQELLEDSDGLAQRVADTGLVDEAWSVLLCRQQLVAACQQTAQELAESRQLKERLQAAERTLCEQSASSAHSHTEDEAKDIPLDEEAVTSWTVTSSPILVPRDNPPATVLSLAQLTSEPAVSTAPPPQHT
jgi:uncharacterized membrane protein YccC